MSQQETIDEQLISKFGLALTEELNALSIAPGARVFAFRDLKDVFIMESDLYGNMMPEGSSFLAFHGHHGLMGKHIKIETLKNSRIDDIKKMVETNEEG